MSALLLVVLASTLQAAAPSVRRWDAGVMGGVGRPLGDSEEAGPSVGLEAGLGLDGAVSLRLQLHLVTYGLLDGGVVENWGRAVSLHASPTLHLLGRSPLDIAVGSAFGLQLGWAEARYAGTRVTRRMAALTLGAIATVQWQVTEGWSFGPWAMVTAELLGRACVTAPSSRCQTRTLDPGLAAAMITVRHSWPAGVP